MTKALILNKNNPINVELIKLLKSDAQIQIQTFDGNPQSSEDYQPYLKNIDWIISGFGPMDVDLDFEALFEAIDEIGPKISHFVVLSYAGIDEELQNPPEFPKVDDRNEFLKEQRYAIKVVDESEVPYTVIRLEKVISGPKEKLVTFPEGKEMPSGTVTTGTVAEYVFDILKNNQALGESIGVINK